MKTLKAFPLIAVFVLLAMAIGVTWVVAQSENGNRVEKITEINQYLPIVLRPWNPFQEIERDALIALYQNTDGENWTNSTGWLGNEDHCNWYGVGCVSGRVTKFDLGDNQLSGPIPPELGNLSNLEELGLEFNQLNGPIPKELGKLSNLEYLGLSDNQLSSPIPKELGSLGNLEVLYLEGNQLSDPIPKELGDLSSLDELDLYGNQLSGPIPPELGNLSNLGELYLGDNQLSGPIPKELSNLSNLQGLSLTINQLSCWETMVVLQWAQSVSFHLWDDPPGTTICEP